MVVLLTEPEVGVKETEAAYPLPAVVLISKPEGAVRIRLAVKLLPLTVKLWAAEAVPLQVLNELRLPVILTVGVSVVTVSVNGTELLTHPVAVLITVRLKL